MTTMTIADAPDADARIADFIEDCRRHRIRCDSFHFGSGYTSIGNRRYVFNWNRDKFPDPAATMARLKAAGMQPVTNIKPCLLDDHPRLAEARASGILVADGETGEPAVAQFWDGLGFHVDFTNPKGRHGGADGIRRRAARLWRHRRVERQQRISRSGTRTRSATATADHIRRRSPGLRRRF